MESASFVISPFSRRPRVDDGFAEKTWSTLSHAIREINKRKTSDLSYEELYRFAYNMVLHKHGKYLYEGLANLLSEHLSDVAVIINSSTHANFLSELRKQWAWFEISLGHVRDVLMYMDRAFAKPRKMKSVNDLGVSLFRDIIIKDESINPRLVEAVLGKIDSERNGESIDTQLIRAIARMLAELGKDEDEETPVYVSVFENTFIDRTKQFYAREAVNFLTDTTCSDYLKKAAQRIREEKHRVESYLEPQTEFRVCSATEDELITKYMKKLVNMTNSGLVWMLRNDKVYDLKLMHALFRNVKEGDDILRTNLRNEILQRGNALVREAQESNDPNSLVSAILALKEKYDRILGISFCIPTSIYDSDMFDIPASSSTAMVIEPAVPIAPPTSQKGVPDKKFVNTVNEAFERFLNSCTESAESISMYVDKLIRKEFKGSTDDEIETKLDAVMTLFRYLHEKDVFEKYYKIHLSKRLLESKSANSDAERSFISKMKNECGYLYTSKMEVMFKDVKMSEESSGQFLEYVANQGIDMRGIELRVSVLTTLSWPIANNPINGNGTAIPMCNLPPDAQHATSEFEKFYLGKHNGRVLTWQKDTGSSEIRGRFQNGAKEVDIVASTHAMCVLMLYNDKDTLTFKELLDTTQINEDELKRIMQSLSLTKYKILTKSPATKEVNAEDTFTFNERFNSRSRRVKIQMIAAPREKVEKQMRARIDDDRKPLIEAAIVRVMKANRIMEHNKLIVEVTNQVMSRFQPNPQDIKRRIESLVEREFLERKEDQREFYQYIA